MSDTQTPTPNIIKKEGLAPARQPILKRLKQVMDARIKIASGPQADGIDTDDSGSITKPPPSLCIMEATSYILGWDQEPGHNVNDGPPCTSEIITSLMIELNDDDNVSNRARSKMKEVIPDIINTAPLIWAVDKYNGCAKDHKTGKCLRDANNKVIWPEKLRTNSTDPDYQDAENKRDGMINDFIADQPKRMDGYGNIGVPAKGQIPMSRWIKLIRELAAVAKFDTANRETEQDLDTPAVDLDEQPAPDPQRVIDHLEGNKED